jgi:hypothetical protein
MVGSRRAGVVLVVFVLVFGLGGLAGAKKRHKKRHAWATQVTLAHPSATQYTGAVKSNLAACRNQRLVTLYYTDPTTLQTQPLSVQRTDKFGKYRVDLTQPGYGGTYQAQVPKVSKQRTELCRAGQSNVITVAGVPPAP